MLSIGVLAGSSSALWPAGSAALRFGVVNAFSPDTVMELKKKAASEKPDHKGETQVEVNVLKNRNGAPGYVNLTFNGALQSFKEIA